MAHHPDDHKHRPSGLPETPDSLAQPVEPAAKQPSVGGNDDVAETVKSHEQASEYGRDASKDELSVDELEEVVGGLTTVSIPLCKNCHQRVAVHQMTVCAVCFVKLK